MSPGGPRLFVAIATLATSAALAQTPPARLKVERPVQEIPAAETGIASVYSDDLEGELTASGQRYDGDRLTAAHRTLPLGTRLKVTDPATGTTVRVVVNDRWGGGPGRGSVRRAGYRPAGLWPPVNLIRANSSSGTMTTVPRMSTVIRFPFTPACS